MLTDALGREVRVISAAVDGFVSTQERLVLNLMVLPRCPDAVVIVDGFNDAAMPAMFGVRPGDPINQGLLYRRFYATADGLMRLIADHSAVVRYLWHTRMMDALDENRRRIAGSDAAIAHYGRSTAAVYLDNVSRMLARCRQRGVPCAAFVQPARSLLPAPSRAGGSAWAEQETLERASYAAIRTRLGEKKHDGVHDLSRVFGRTGRSWFYDPVHFGDRGQQAFAKATLPAVLAMLGGDLRPPGATRCEQ
jgi:lysophospholipase L1-like esterase